jgi:hypothetical protein
MRITRELAALAVSAPLMAFGLGAVVLGESWPMRLGGVAMVIGGSIAMAVTGRVARRAAWTVAALGATLVLVGCF